MLGRLRFWTPPTLYVDPRRYMEVVREERRVELEGDVGYKDKVKRRMLLGLTSKELPPLVKPRD